MVKKRIIRIKSLSRLLLRENRPKRNQQYYCLNCLNAFNLQSSRDKHYGNCIDHKAVQIEMPWKEKDKYDQYHNGEKQFKVPFIMYADFESILEPMEKNSRGRVNKHVPSRILCIQQVCIRGCSRSTKTL